MNDLTKIKDVFFDKCVIISNLLKNTNLADLGKEVSINSSGDKMKKLDYDSNNIIYNDLLKLKCVTPLNI
tara:strand:- start:927 stop:1136 length:210 start_codon:yes stop_codon:yes gene_type:complete